MLDWTCPFTKHTASGFKVHAIYTLLIFLIYDIMVFIHICIYMTCGYVFSGHVSIYVFGYFFHFWSFFGYFFHFFSFLLSHSR